MSRDGMKKSNLYMVSLILLMVSLLGAGGTIGNANEKPNIYLTNRSRGKVLKPYYQLLSLKPLIVSLDDPTGITCGPSGLLYVAEPSKGKIVRFNQQGDYKKEVLVDEPGSGFSGSPVNLTFGPNGNLFFTTPESGIWTLEDGDPTKNPEKLIRGKFFDEGEKPHDLAFLKTGENSDDLVVSVITGKPLEGYIVRLLGPDYNQVRKFISQYSYTEMGNMVSQHLQVPVALGVNEVGEVFVAEHGRQGNHVLRYAPNGEFVDIFVENLVRPMDLNFDSSGKLYATLGPLRPGEPASGGLKIYTKSGVQELYIPRQNIWGIALCED